MSDRLLTYRELGALLGCSPAAARARAIRKRWRKQVSNDGLARVCVPADEDLTCTRTPHVQPDVTGSHTPTHTCSLDAELLARLDRLQAEMTAMAQRLGASDAELAAAKATVNELRQDRDAWRAQIEGARSEVERARNEAEQARNELAAYRARPWWRRAFG